MISKPAIKRLTCKDCRKPKFFVLWKETSVCSRKVCLSCGRSYTNGRRMPTRVNTAANDLTERKRNIEYAKMRYRNVRKKSSEGKNGNFGY